MRRTLRPLGLALAVSILSAGWSGCGDDFAPSTEAEQPDVYPDATTRDLLVDDLVRAYNERNAGEYEKLLDAGFVFYFAPEEIEDLGQGASWNRAQDVASAQRMFMGQPGQTPDGNPVGPVQKIQLTLVPNDGAGWTDPGSEDFAGTTMRRFKVDMLVTFISGSREQVSGLQVFYAAAKTLEAKDGSAITVYRLKYWRDLGNRVTKASLATETTSWGNLKSRF
jgi:hypothetical protein